MKVGVLNNGVRMKMLGGETEAQSMQMPIDITRPSPTVATVVIVTFNSSSTLPTCLSSIPPDCEVIIVDQRSSDDSREIARRVRPDALLIENLVNTGYSLGCNLGAQHARADILIFLNPDAAFLSADGANLLAQATLNHNALVAPKIFDIHSSDITLVRPWSNLRGKLCAVLLNSKPRLGFVDVFDSAYVSGPCLALSAENFWAVGGFDERFFLYREEETLARRLNKISVPCCLDARIKVSHVGGVSTSQMPEFSFQQGVRSDVLFFVTHFTPAKAALISLALGARLLAIALLLPILRYQYPSLKNISALCLLRAIKEIYNGWRAIPVQAPQPKHPQITNM